MMPTATVCRVFPHDADDGPQNMARDEALLELVARDPSAAAFRTYGWSKATLSLGYFQAIAAAESQPRWQGLPLVRRATGGGAIWHDREITYALAIPRDHPLARQGVRLYQAVHEAIAAILADLGIGAERRGAHRAATPGDPRPFLCFLDRDAEDLVVGPSKIVGSAQRRRAGTILQHGSILLRGSPAAPELPGIADLAGTPGDVRPWAARLAQEIPLALGFQPEPVAWNEALLERAEELSRTVYTNPAWTRRR